MGLAMEKWKTIYMTNERVLKFRFECILNFNTNMNIYIFSCA